MVIKGREILLRVTTRPAHCIGSLMFILACDLLLIQIVTNTLHSFYL